MCEVSPQPFLPLRAEGDSLHNARGNLIASNNNWQQTIIGGIITHGQVQDIQNRGHAPADLSESAIIANLPAGNYAAIDRAWSKQHHRELRSWKCTTCINEMPKAGCRRMKERKDC
jgi:hypothetical protein